MKTKQTQRKIQGHIKKTFVPHKANQYRPHLVRWHGLTAVIVLALLLQVVYGFVASGRLAVLARVSTIDTTQLLSDTNNARVAEGIPELAIDPALNRAAQLKAEDMFTHNYWAHVSPTGVAPWKWIGDVGYSYSQAGENLAKNYPNASATIDAWLASPTHRANMLHADYEDVGFAVVEGELDGEPTTIVVALYGLPAGKAVAGQAVDTGTVTAPPIGAGGFNPLEQFSEAFRSLSPASLGVLVLLIAVGAVAISAHHYRHHLPPTMRKSWHRHHGLYTFIGAAGLAFLMILATGSGQI